MPTDLRFEKLRMINHAGKVIIFGESKGESDDDVDHTGKLWYRVLDLEQSADQDNPNAWDDNTRWTDWMEIPYPQELRDVAMSLLTIRQTVDDKVHDQLKAWRVLSDGDHLYLFRAIDLAASETTDFDVSDPALPPEPTPDPAGDNPLEADLSSIRVYANRFVVRRDISPASGTNRGASGQEITVPQLALKSESRYRRSQMRETPQSDLDGQGFLNMGSELFEEPTMEFSMVAPVGGLFTGGPGPFRSAAKIALAIFLESPRRQNCGAVLAARSRRVGGL